jgi:DNA-binding NarL/FixJ family response regulator
MGTIRILIAEHREIVRAGLRSTLSAEQELAVVGDTADTQELFRLAEKETPEVLLLGLALPHVQNMSTLKELRKRSPETWTLILMDQVSEPDFMELILAGAKGYLLNTASTASLIMAVKTLASKEYWVDRKMIGKLFGEFLRLLNPPEGKSTPPDGLTKREIEILKLLAQGCKNKEIANRLVISEKTVKTHLTNIFSKLKISDRLQAALYVIKHRLGA